MGENVWKVGSRWSENGRQDTSLLRIFRRNGVVFIGQKNRLDKISKVTPGDYLAITDGVTIVAVARALDNPKSLSELIDKQIVVFKDTDKIGGRTAESVFADCNLWKDVPVGVRVNIVECDKKKYDRGTFQKINKSDVKRFVIDAYNEGSTKNFDINASTYTLIKTADDKKSIIDTRSYFNIPIYQREYAWGEEQVSRFIKDIIYGYENNEPMFIGTMQLSAPKLIDEKTQEQEYDVIDGQQRLSTIFCLLSYLKLRYPNNARVNTIRLDWLDTMVNNGKERELLKRLNEISVINGLYKYDGNTNRYIGNTQIIDEIFNEYLSDEEGNVVEFNNVDDFVDFVLRSLFFVVIETHSGLSKTIKIFNTINTAGLDLNGDDLFKVRFFEYLKDKRNAHDSMFSEISRFYGLVKERNQIWRKENNEGDIVSIGEIRSIYKDYLIAAFFGWNSKAKEMHSMSTDTFFEYLFDQLLGTQDRTKEIGQIPDNFKMSIKDLYAILEISERWNRHTRSIQSQEQYISWRILNMSRYRRFRRIAYQVMLLDKDDLLSVAIEKAHKVLSVISRVAYCDSIRYAKVVNDTVTNIEKLYYTLYSEGYDVCIEELKKMLLSRVDNLEFNVRKCQIFENGKCHRTWGNLICILSEMLEEISSNPKISVQELNDIIYAHNFDLEHIHASGDSSIVVSPELQNSIGNLMLLEFDINRSIGKKVFNEKKVEYARSRYATCKRIAKFDKWDVDEIKERRDEESGKIYEYIGRVL